jgi:murein DD-endopeptidase MepM/ murein hydrolase activator NlpD
MANTRRDYMQITQNFGCPMKGYSLAQCTIGCKFGCGYTFNKECTAHKGKPAPCHKGIDFNGIPGRTIKDAEVVASAAGSVISLNNGCTHNTNLPCECGAGWGNYVKIKHDNGYITVYAHLATVKVANGAKVTAGQVLGTVGRTGRVVSSKQDGGYHLHFEVHNAQDVAIDPLGATPAAPSSYPKPTGTLKSGVKNDQVKWLQDALNKIMKSGLEIDGSFGPKTEAAVKDFQKKYGLAVDGSFGPNSLAKMVQLVG